ncbi:DUF2141 domain-containing protein [Gelidibacter japonicus]|uniref:DUF2141 domain-containing protein n=1 Tax=Gelidibacter japonicus TaxID=1962232 RepID=UPI0020217F8B|nr:DUF2141 domain-containing protein [Gelidibacter japonicus]MCL8007262.1 DUF2141 domain-containing protein [Gelidibacter japonicus]
MEKTLILGLVLFVASIFNTTTDSHSLTVKVADLQNSKGTVLVALYNRDGTIPDEHFKDYYKKKIGEIVDGKTEVTFNNLPQGTYAISILHDENNNGKVDKKFMLPLPKEGVGFSNYDDFGLSNRPNFKKASFNLSKDTVVEVKIIYK